MEPLLVSVCTFYILYEGSSVPKFNLHPGSPQMKAVEADTSAAFIEKRLEIGETIPAWCFPSETYQIIILLAVISASRRAVSRGSELVMSSGAIGRFSKYLAVTSQSGSGNEVGHQHEQKCWVNCAVQLLPVPRSVNTALHQVLQPPSKQTAVRPRREYR